MKEKILQPLPRLGTRHLLLISLIDGTGVLNIATYIETGKSPISRLLM